MRTIDADRLKAVLEKNFGHTGGASVLEQLIDEQPTIEPSTNCSEFPNNSDTVSRQAAIDEIKTIYEWHDTVTMERLVEHINNLPTVQPETPCYLGSPCEYQNPGVVITQPDFAAGKWIVHLYKLGVSRYECDTCHARCDIIYPYCPYCGEKKEGERYAND